MAYLSKIDYIAPIVNAIDVSSVSVYCASGNIQNYNVNDFSVGWTELK